MNEYDNTVPPSPPAAPPPPASSSSDDRTWALIAHLSAFSFFISGIGCVLGPLIVWLVKRDTLPFAADQAKEALNFNLTLAIAFVALLVLTVATFGIGIVLAWPIGVALFVAWFVLTIVAAVKASEGVAYRYPFALRLIR
ncbi:MAG TPA: DUF4870 domain-containing protein [Dokdonella sp.]